MNFIQNIINLSENKTQNTIRRKRTTSKSEGASAAASEVASNKKLDSIVERVLKSLNDSCNFPKEFVQELVEAKGFNGMHLIQFALYKCNNHIDPTYVVIPTLRLLKNLFGYDSDRLEKLLLSTDSENMTIFHTFIDKCWYRDDMTLGFKFLLTTVFEDLKVNPKCMEKLFLDTNAEKLNFLQFICSKFFKKSKILSVSSEILKFLAKFQCLSPIFFHELLQSKVFNDSSILMLQVEKYFDENHSEQLVKSLTKIYEDLDENFGVDFDTYKKLLLSSDSNGMKIIQNIVSICKKPDPDVNFLIYTIDCVQQKLKYSFEIMNDIFFSNDNFNLFKNLNYEKGCKNLQDSLIYLKQVYQIDCRVVQMLFSHNCYSNKNLLQFMIQELEKKSDVHHLLIDLFSFLKEKFQFNGIMVKNILALRGYNKMTAFHYIVFECRSALDAHLEIIFPKLFIFLKEKLSFIKENLMEILMAKCWNGMNFFNYFVSKSLKKFALERELSILFSSLRRIFKVEETVIKEILISKNSNKLTLLDLMKKKGLSEPTIKNMLEELLSRTNCREALNTGRRHSFQNIFQ